MPILCRIDCRLPSLVCNFSGVLQLCSYPCCASSMGSLSFACLILRFPLLGLFSFALPSCLPRLSRYLDPLWGRRQLAMTL